MDKVDTSTNERLKSIRESLKINQLDFAASLGIRQSYYSEVETGKRKVGAKVIEKLKQLYGVSTDWMYSGEGDIYSEKRNKKSDDFIVPSMYPSVREHQVNIRLLHTYSSLEEKELDFWLSIEIEELREVYNDYQKLVETMYKLNPPKFLKEKYKPGSDFREWKEAMDGYFEQDHKHLKDPKAYKALKIIELYRSEKEGWQRSLSKLIDYLHRYADFFLEDEEIKNKI